MDVKSIVHILAILTSSAIVILATSILHSMTKSNRPRRKVINSFWMLVFVVILSFFNDAKYFGWIGWYSPLEFQKSLSLLVVLFSVSLFSTSMDYFVYDGIYKRKNLYPAPKILTNILKFLVYFIAFCFAMQSIYGIHIETILASAGIGGIVLGFSAQNTLSNLFSGIAIQFGGKLQMGDWIESSGFSGRISEFNWRSVTVGSLKTYIIPNTEIASSTLAVYTPGKRFSEIITLTFRQEGSILVIKEALSRVIDKCCFSESTFISIGGFIDNSISVKIHVNFYSRLDYYTTKSHIMTGVLSESMKQRFSLSNSNFTENICIQEPPKAPPSAWIESMFNISEVFSKLPDSYCKDVLEQAQIEFYLDNEVIYRQGQDGDTLFFVLSGSASSFENEKESISNKRIENEHREEVELIPSAGNKQANEKKQSRTKMRDFTTGEFFGLQSFSTGKTRRTTLIATSVMWVVVIKRAEFADVLKVSKTFMDHLIDLLAQREKENLKSHQDIKKNLKKQIKERLIQLFLTREESKRT